MYNGNNDLQFITSRQNSAVLNVRKLAEKKVRNKEKLFRFDGIKLFIEAVASEVEIETVFIKKDSAERIYEKVGEYLKTYKNVKLLDDGVFDSISEEKSPEGILCVARHIDKSHKNVVIDDIDPSLDGYISANDKVFVLESVRDPGNLGTIIRSATAFGVDVIVMSDDCAELYNPKTIRASMGTLFKQKTVTTSNLPGMLRALSNSGRNIYAAALDDEARLLGKLELNTSDCIVVGNEGHGLSEKTISACDEKILIPMTKNAESLNASIASSICLWEQFGRNL